LQIDGELVTLAGTFAHHAWWQFDSDWSEREMGKVMQIKDSTFVWVRKGIIADPICTLESETLSERETERNWVV